MYISIVRVAGDLCLHRCHYPKKHHPHHHNKFTVHLVFYLVIHYRFSCNYSGVHIKVKAAVCHCRYKAVERVAAEEFERERPKVPTRGRTEITLCLSPNPASRSASRCATPSSVISQEDTSTITHQSLGTPCLSNMYSSLGLERYVHE